MTFLVMHTTGRRLKGHPSQEESRCFSKMQLQTTANINPFECYNGIVGRALNSRILIDAGLDGILYLSLSHTLFQRKAEYFEKLGLAQKNGDYRSWMEFFIKAILDAAQNGIHFITEFNQFTAKDETELLNRQSRQDDHTLEVYR